MGLSINIDGKVHDRLCSSSAFEEMVDYFDFLVINSDSKLDRVYLQKEKYPELFTFFEEGESLNPFKLAEEIKIFVTDENAHLPEAFQGILENLRLACQQTQRVISLV